MLRSRDPALQSGTSARKTYSSADTRCIIRCLPRTFDPSMVSRSPPNNTDSSPTAITPCVAVIAIVAGVSIPRPPLLRMSDKERKGSWSRNRQYGLLGHVVQLHGPMQPRLMKDADCSIAASLRPLSRYKQQVYMQELLAGILGMQLPASVQCLFGNKCNSTAFHGSQ